jgi:hypothetical protein
VLFLDACRRIQQRIFDAERLVLGQESGPVAPTPFLAGGMEQAGGLSTPHSRSECPVMHDQYDEDGEEHE